MAMLNNQRVKTAGNLCFLTGCYAYVLRNVKDTESVKTPSGGDKKNEVPLLSLFCSLLHESGSLVDIAWRVGLADQSRRRLEIEYIESESVWFFCSQIFKCHVLQQKVKETKVTAVIPWRPEHSQTSKRGAFWGFGVHQASIQCHSPSIQHPFNIHQTSIKHPHTSTILTGANRIFSGFAGERQWSRNGSGESGCGSDRGHECCKAVVHCDGLAESLNENWLLLAPSIHN